MNFAALKCCCNVARTLSRCNYTSAISLKNLHPNSSLKITTPTPEQVLDDQIGRPNRSVSIAFFFFLLDIRRREDLLRVHTGRRTGNQVQHVQRSGRSERRQSADQSRLEVQSGIGQVVERRCQAKTR